MGNATRECKSCRSMVPLDAVKCPMCGEWREDIKRERDLYYLWLFFSVLPLILFFVGVYQGWWLGQETIETTIFGTRISIPVLKEFAWSTFFSSPFGLFLAVSFSVAHLISWKYYISVSRKIGKWVWF